MEVLDYLDPDPDLEDGADAEPDQDGEPSLGSLDAQSQSRWSGGVSSTDDYELDEVDDEEGGDTEPSLGSLSKNINQDFWGRYCIGQDLEDERDGAEPCCEDEGAQCDDEGAQDADIEGWQHPEFSDYGGRVRSTAPAPVFPRSTYTVEDWRAEQAAQARTSMEAAKAINALQKVMVSHGQAPVPQLRVLGGAIVKG